VPCPNQSTTRHLRTLYDAVAGVDAARQLEAPHEGVQKDFDMDGTAAPQLHQQAERLVGRRVRRDLEGGTVRQ